MFANEIVLLEDKRAVLQGKLDEYRGRPEAWGSLSSWDADCNDVKIMVLEALLQNGVVVSGEIEARLRLTGKFNKLVFENSVGVINNYVTDRPANIDGTGLGGLQNNEGMRNGDNYCREGR